MIDLYETTIECEVFDTGHRFLYDAELSTPSNSVFSCICEALLEEIEDAPAGA